MQKKHVMEEKPALAIVGFSFELPQDATSSERFWKMICEGRSTNAEFPADRLNVEAFYHPDGSRPSTIPVRGANFVQNDLGSFDAPFFSITPAEAACMDPQHRRMLETAYHALEDAGIPLERCSGSDTSVYTGCFTNDYLSILQQDFDAEQRHAAMGIAYSMLANRLSWFFNFKGTSMNIDSACSSSLIALHLACQDLLSGSASMALVGGANLVYHPNFMKFMAGFNFLSPDNKCWSFDQRANGYSRGEGSIVLVIKRVEDALRDGDTIRAVIRNTGTNQDGRTPGITQPSLESQVNLIERTYAEANIDMEPTRFFEAHGTGTPVGDPVEANAIGQAFRKYRSKEDPLYVGAVKASIGHLEGASGLAGIVKTLLVLENGLIPPIAGLESINSRIDPEKLGLHFPRKLLPWPTPGLRRACVNSFGFGGTNASVILDDAHHYLQIRGLRGHTNTRTLEPIIESTLCKDPCANGSVEETAHLIGTNGSSTLHSPVGVAKASKLLVLSANDKLSCQRMLAEYRAFACNYTGEISNLAHTLATKRSLLPWRNFLAIDHDGTVNDTDIMTASVKTHATPRIAFLLTGQGAQYHGMGSDLMRFSTFRDSLSLQEECLAYLGVVWSLPQLLDKKQTSLPIDDPEYAQPLTTCVQIALVDLLRSFGITPHLTIGHSSGEIAAAYAAGELTRFSAVKVAYYRGLLSSRLAKHKTGLSMMAVAVSKEDALSYLNDLKQSQGKLGVGIGCVNGPKNVTLTGEIDQLQILENSFTKKQIFCRLLRVSVAYHSPAMSEIASEYKSAMGDLSSQQTLDRIQMISSVTGHVVAPNTLCRAEYWIENLTSTVEFHSALRKILAQASKKPRKQLGQSQKIDLRVSHILEVGPHSALQGPVSETLVSECDSHNRPSYIPTLDRKVHADYALILAMGKLHCAGFPVNLQVVNGIEGSLPIPPHMPPYPFNHTQSYWNEGRLSRNFRFRDTPRHDLLGTRTIDQNPLIAQWRNVLRLSEVPWLSDHKVNGQVVFPAVAMVVMAFEAFRQLFAFKGQLLDVQIKDIDFLYPFRFANGVDKVESQLTLLSESNPDKHSDWSRFRIFVIENDEYVECCAGYVRGNFDPACPTTDAPFMNGETTQSWIEETAAPCRSIYHPYNNTKGSDVWYGPAFQTLDSMRLGENGEVTADVRLGKSSQFNDQHHLHPCTMDGLVQLMVPALAHTRDHLPTMVPAHASMIGINCQNAESLSGGSLIGAARARIQGPRGAVANIVGATGCPPRPVVYFEGLQTGFLSSLEGTSTADEEERDLCTRVSWKPDIDMINDEQLLAEISRERPNESIDSVSQNNELMVVLLCLISEALEYLQNRASTPVPEYLNSYVTWMRYQQTRNEALRTASDYLISHPNERKEAEERLEAVGIDGRFFIHVGRNLISVLSREADPLDLMFRNGLADLYYEQMLANPYHAHPISVYIDYMSFKNPSMKILEVGAGTGGQTLRTLETLRSNDLMKCARFDYTDISPGFFPRAKEKFAEYTDVMNYRVLDISRDPVSQSFEPETYDLVLASHVLHATDNLEQSLRNIRRLLKPGGKLLLAETTKPDALHIGFAFGLLKGWWNPLTHESRSTLSPCLETSQWNGQLKASGFSGVDIDIPGQQYAECQYSSIIISTALRDSVSQMSREVVVIRDPDSAYQANVAQLIAERFSVSSYTLPEAAALEISSSTILVFLVELHKPFLDGISRVDFDLLRNILVRSKNILWATKGTSCENLPQYGLIEGLSRTLASEDSSRKFVTLALEHQNTESQITGFISQIISKIQTDTIDNLEMHYTSSNAVLTIPRVSESYDMSQQVMRSIKPRREETQTIGPNTNVSLRVMSPGNLDTLEYIEGDPEDDSAVFDSTVADDELVITVKAIGLGLQDYLAAIGELDKGTLGEECAGVVRLAGSQTSFRPGDRVCVLGSGLARTSVRVKSQAAVAIPASMTFAEAASLPVALWLAYYSLIRIGMLEKGDLVLIHQVCSSVGQVLTQLALSYGAHVLGTVSSPSERNFACTKLGLASEMVILASAASFCTHLRQATSERGIDVVVGSLADLQNVDMASCLGAHPRLIDIGPFQSQKHQNQTRLSRMEGMNASYSSLRLTDLIRQKPDFVCRILHEAVREWPRAHFFTPLSLNPFHAAEAKEAFRSFQRDASGRQILELQDGMDIKVNKPGTPNYQFNKDASYVIAGGLGGLGRSFARWMVGRGARHLILLSRSGPTTDTAKALVAELKMQSVNVATPRVDIGNLDALQEAIDSLSMPPIRGCIQATVALRDTLFEKMTYDDWIISTGSKVKGSWNLHLTVPDDVDFFILISSINGIFGSSAQANYAAGNAFKDSLAHHRLQKGLKAVSIDLGLMVQEGVIAESQFLLDSVRRIGHLMEIQQTELLALMDYYCDPQLPILRDDQAQILVGIEMPSKVTAKGIDLHHSIHRPIFRHLFRMGLQSKSSASDQRSHQDLSIDRPAALKEAASTDEAVSLITQWVKAKVAHILGLATTDIESERPVHSYGIDSLVAVDLKNWFDRDIGANITVFDLMSNMPLSRLSALAEEQSRFRPSPQ